MAATAKAPGRGQDPSTAGIDGARAALREAGYQQIAHYPLSYEGTLEGSITMYGGREVLLLHVRYRYEGERRLRVVDGWDVYAPVTASNKVDDTIEAIRKRAKSLEATP